MFDNTEAGRLRLSSVARSELPAHCHLQAVCSMSRPLKNLLVAGFLAFIPSHAFAQTSGAAVVDNGLATPTGHEVDFTFGGYTYAEPGDTSISIHGPKFGGEYTGTMSLSPGQHWFLQGDARGLVGKTTYN